MEHSIVGTKRQDRARNTDIRMKTKLTDILLLIDHFRMVPKRWEEKPWKTVHKMGGRHQDDSWPKVETGNSGQTTVEIVGGGLRQEAH
ncbi:hypothetical protein EVAR_60974_1 [Eumeta japonica]|uniref:Uncharacterized protein n=1 Tax=Eumeta variegata TaxID=151549 RepID=A0A4C1XXF0_EUMVA|nr:hypothetical protein EVAR_60974_1 [Eumeta japonica]